MIVKLLFLFALIQIGLGVEDVIQEDGNRVTDKGDYLLVCKQEPIEIGIVLDSSSSIHESDFKKAKTFLQNFLKQFHIGTGRNDVRVAIIPFGRGIYKRYAFNLDTYDSNQAVEDAIGRIRHMSGLRTDTGYAVEYMHKTQMNPRVTRPWAEKVSIVITDGNSQRTAFTAEQSKLARDDGIDIFAIGVGSVKESELLNIAGELSRVTRVASYSDLDGIKELLASKTCIIKWKPTTTPIPQTFDMCGQLHPADINFIFSPTDLGASATGWVTEAFSMFVEDFNFGLGFRFGAVTGTCPDAEGQELSQYQDKEKFKSFLRRYEHFRLSTLIEQATETAYKPSNGGRADVRDVAVVAVNGELEDVEANEQAIADMVAKGIEVYIIDPYNSGIEYPGTTTIEGEGTRTVIESLIDDLCQWN